MDGGRVGRTGHPESSMPGPCPPGAFYITCGAFQEVNGQTLRKVLYATMERNTKDSGTREERTPS